MFWDDSDLRKLIKSDYPQFIKYYDLFNYHIIRVDFARLCILHKYGGIYADMDIYCYKNFYDRLNEKDIYMVESWEDWGEKVQNSLMISNVDNDFWMKCCDETIKIVNSKNNINIDIDLDSEKRKNYILEFCGPKMLSKIIDESVGILPKELFNPRITNQFNWAKYDYQSESHLKALEEFNYLNNLESEVITRHYLTGNWCKII
jgi:hypothetical protein